MAKRDKAKRKRKNKRPATVVELRDHVKKAASAGERDMGVPTGERLHKAQGAWRQGEGDKAFRIEDAPLQKLAARGALVPKDPALNRVLLEAGERYYKHWYLGGLASLGGIDPSAPSGKNLGQPIAPGAFSSENTMRHRQEYRSAMAALDPYVWPVLHAVVINERTIEETAAMFTTYKNRTMAIAVAMDRLRGALIKLAAHFHLANAEALGVAEKAKSLDAITMGSHSLRHESGLRPQAR